mmetsp:Transcript_17531/g.48938  ORF Transcript_17531/g.48938 Transcript_17531/m.48938 type:complete len:137 (+) Transcript_17531:148-558(+)|eukprot:CAMPEP_0117665626 /NCGR_PEP_ID=MMETSP0804-20121206/9918_1 /TAXON_ID=1074897 /ORGANISM="Tetraselmis astigmatica, Strain CCMP880" /LENGTH=136 /DNA_ID=CAMNT_0005473067 /DNA_START=749 /DNA_END=1159 /DNA_ORIENTATION=+
MKADTLRTVLAVALLALLPMASAGRTLSELSNSASSEAVATSEAIATSEDVATSESSAVKTSSSDGANTDAGTEAAPEAAPALEAEWEKESVFLADVDTSLFNVDADIEDGAEMRAVEDGPAFNMYKVMGYMKSRP